ncbi:hypothetical protein E2C01_094801 [Portunus trituberculatus]|uniref:Uncharacterized protein n=1 Tax=Portunus trituberculatus TaxID=210409 RepID=A0A5B7JRE4_PORTR|nr:hypothetical protein [Portunus trituberculatus]
MTCLTLFLIPFWFETLYLVGGSSAGNTEKDNYRRGMERDVQPFELMPMGEVRETQYNTDFNAKGRNNIQIDKQTD